MTEPRDDRPVVVLAMFGGLAPHLLDESMERLATMAVVADPLPLERFDDDRADELLAGANVLLTGWLCPPVTAEVLDRAPQLRLIAHAAGTVKEHLTPAVWERGIQVSSAAAANAVPVAEYCLAAILFANKHVFAARNRYHDRREEMLLPMTAGNRAKTIGVVGASRVGRHLLALLRTVRLRCGRLRSDAQRRRRRGARRRVGHAGRAARAIACGELERSGGAEHREHDRGA